MKNRRSRNQKATLILFILMVSASFTLFSQKNEFYVDPVSGDDGNKGTSKEEALKTVFKAKELVKEQIKNTEADITVYLMDGNYHFDETLNFSSSDGGSGNQEVVYKNYRDAQPVFSSGKTVSQWKLEDKEKNIYSAKVENDFRQLYVNDELRTLARYPNMKDDKSFGPQMLIKVLHDEQIIRIEKADLPFEPDYNSMEVAIAVHYTYFLMLVDSWESAPNDSILIKPVRKRVFHKIQKYFDDGTYAYLQNSYELLDAPGEWYLDREELVLYYIPMENEDIDNLEAIYPSVETLVKIEGEPEQPVKKLKFEGIKFSHTNYTVPSEKGLRFGPCCNPLGDTENLPAIVSVHYADNLTIHRNVFKHAGGTGLEFYKGVKNSVVKGNVFHSIMGNGLIVDTHKKKNPTKANHCENILISNNFLNRTGRMYSIAAGMVLKYVKEITIEHNELMNMPYMGIGVGWFTGRQGRNIPHVYVGISNNLIQNNYIHHVMQLHDDAAGIYTLSQQPGTIIRENYITNIFRSLYTPLNRGSYRTAESPVAGIYLDNQSEFILVERNVIRYIDLRRTTYEQSRIGAQNNMWINNVAYDKEIENKAGLEDAYKSIKKGFDD